MEQILNDIAQEYSKFEFVKALVLSGSRTSDQNDNLSDYDIYIYSDKEISTTFRKELAKKYSDNFEIDNRYFETGDEWVLRDNKTYFDFMFRNTDWIENSIKNIYEEYHASNGYSTCFLHNVSKSKIIYEKDKWFTNLKNKIKKEYPKELKSNIIKRNIMLLCDKKSASYLEQIHNAIKRDDIIAINHRLAAFFASYFDIIFAINEIYHPGEKRLIKYAKQYCKILPLNFEENIKNLFNKNKNEKIEILNKITENLKEIIPIEYRKKED